MEKLRGYYRKLDREIRKLSRTQYAVLIGATAGLSTLFASTAFGDPDIIFSTVMGLTLTVLNYLTNPNQEK